MAFSIDGKGIAGTLVDRQGRQQNFLSLVSLYCQEQGMMLSAKDFENQQQSELEVLNRSHSSLPFTKYPYHSYLHSATPESFNPFGLELA